MFTGLVVELGEVVSLMKKEQGARLALRASVIAADARIGDSIAINGTCLTVVKGSDDVLSFDLSDETLRSSNLGTLKAGDRVNLEPALRLDARLGGHLVTGHIDGVGRISSKTVVGEGLKVVVRTIPEITGFLVPKGSVAVDGISLTVVDVSTDSFSTVIIPHTAAVTTIGFKNPGDTVNIEVDIIGKYVAKFVNRGRQSTLLDTLRQEGYA